MSVRNVDDVTLQPVPAGTDTQHQVLIGPGEAPSFALRRFVMQAGGGMPLHTNTVEHEQYVLRGAAQIQIGEGTHHVKAGDVVYIPAGVPHNYKAAEGDEPFEFICVVPNGPDSIELVDC